MNWLFVFTKSTKSIKGQNANKRIGNFSWMFFVHIFLFLFAVSGFVLVKSYYEKNKTALITLFILLLIYNHLCLSLLFIIFVIIIFICSYLGESFLFAIIGNHLWTIMFYSESLSESDSNFAINSLSTFDPTFSDSKSESDDSESDFN